MSWKKFISLIPVMLDTHTHIILCSWLFHHHVCKFNIIKNTSATSSFQSSIFRFNLNFFVQTNKSETHKKFATVTDFVNILCLYLSCSFFYLIISSFSLLCESIFSSFIWHTRVVQRGIFCGILVDSFWGIEGIGCCLLWKSRILWVLYNRQNFWKMSFGDTKTICNGWGCGVKQSWIWGYEGESAV